MSYLTRISLIALTLTLIACEQDQNSSAPAKSASTASEDSLVVYTTFYPTTFVTKRLVEGLDVQVVCPLPGDADPIFWQPSAETIAEYQGAGLIVTNGADFEKWVARAALPRRRTLESASSLHVPLITMEAVTHSHGTDGQHTHEGIDGHTWVDPLNLIEQTNAIHDRLVEMMPEASETLTRNQARLEDELQRLHDRFAELSERLVDVALFASHPAYNYLASRHDWAVTNLDLDPDAAIDADEASAIFADNSMPRVLLWESEPLDATVQFLNSAFEVQSVVFSPLEGPPESGADYLSEMRSNIDRLEAALSP